MIVLMMERAQHAGAEYRFNSRVIAVAVSKEQVDVTVAEEKKEYQIPARAIVIASGFAPGLNKKLGLGEYKDYAIGAQAEAVAPGLNEVEVYFGDIAPGFFGWLVPTEKGKVKAGLLSREEAGPLLKKWLNQLASQGKIESADVPLNYGGIPLQAANPHLWRTDGCGRGCGGASEANNRRRHLLRLNRGGIGW